MTSTLIDFKKDACTLFQYRLFFLKSNVKYMNNDMSFREYAKHTAIHVKRRYLHSFLKKTSEGAIEIKLNCELCYVNRAYFGMARR